MGPYDPRTKEAWTNLNQRFGKCPECGQEPFEGYDALKSYSRPATALSGVLVALATSNLLSIIPAGDKAVESIGYIIKAYTADSQGAARISEAVMKGNCEITNVEISDGIFRCIKCDETWEPGSWDVSFSDLGLTAYKY
ncbi:hypothetical protein [Haloarcula pellucida]|uniref:Uncharacterized protein n=1 Tax=Haloarcula pellucida TaxID=1427151 RepID=A0A830GJV3_9EURY|nr:hypothetical protein [Halomicroarcula pellucida]MBX0348563.1 hypothetical protein [Halomicroarcula pellucida]GGN92827.1 hypothetical protein GCM10009030_17450 [Halomicroarcula pellucida]